ncbi:MAG: CinA family protein [Magnetococcales bacterium]|nr:CinA family protein [Magnetococcales bacterium]
MKCLLVLPRWSETHALLPASGRPHLDLLLQTLGFTELSVRELEPDKSFDPTAVPEEYQLILAQGEAGGGGRLRRSILSNLGLSLALANDESDRLRVDGARPLHNARGEPTGFAVKRRGRLVAFAEGSLWAVREDLQSEVHQLLHEEWAGRAVRKPSDCWLVEGRVTAAEMAQFLADGEISQISLHPLPDGDTALLLPGHLGEDYKSYLRERFGERLYADRATPLEEVVGERLRAAGKRVALAESCTAGLASARLSAVPGSSAYLHVGIVAYANAAKQRQLAVSESLIAQHGAVSPEVALAMARGAVLMGDADLGVSVTGISGPDGAAPGKPVGTVFFAAFNRDGRVLEQHAVFPGGRHQVRHQASQTALHLLRRMAG